jgi:uncharacterized protein (DUF58 family)
LKNVAGFALTWSSAFIATMAILVNSPALFYMATGLIAMIVACRVQARLACRALRFDRLIPESVQVGELTTIELAVWSERKIRRPLITVMDDLPPTMPIGALTPALPIAPAYDVPVRTQYQFRPLRSGKYRWRGLTAIGTDALGLVSKMKHFDTEEARITVLPKPIPVHIDLPLAAGWGVSEAQSGSMRGAGLEPWGIRNYVIGDSLRHVHWRSTARTGQMLVKEFEAGTHSAAAFLLQSNRGTDIGKGAMSSLETMKGHIAFIAENLLRQGARIELPGLDQVTSHGSQQERLAEIYDCLAALAPDGEKPISLQVAELSAQLPPGSILFVAVVLADYELPGAIRRFSSGGSSVVPLIYDATAFDKKQPGSAAEPDYCRELRAAGASLVMMPLEAPVG